MSNVQDPCVKYVRDWNRADKAIACHHLSGHERAQREADRDRAAPSSIAPSGARAAIARRSVITSASKDLPCRSLPPIDKSDCRCSNVIAPARARVLCCAKRPAPGKLSGRAVNSKSSRPMS